MLFQGHTSQKAGSIDKFAKNHFEQCHLKLENRANTNVKPKLNL